ncbi:MAG: hypothetical protein HYY40_07945 [Bacteroidetes bacterium]|nr:hypothetical protein [Bacteroidota bacterium]
MKPITENIIEESAIEILASQGWEYANACLPPIAPSDVRQGKEISVVKNFFTTASKNQKRNGQ